MENESTPDSLGQPARSDTFEALTDTPVDVDALTPVQQEISDALQGGHGVTHVNDRPAGPTLMAWDVALGVLGIVSLLVGVVLVFFFAALGSVVLVLGGIVCALAFQGAGQVAESSATSASRPPPRP